MAQSCERIIGSERGEKRDLMKDCKEYQGLLDKRLWDCFREFITIDDSLKVLDYDDNM